MSSCQCAYAIDAMSGFLQHLDVGFIHYALLFVSTILGFNCLQRYKRTKRLATLAMHELGHSQYDVL